MIPTPLYYLHNVIDEMKTLNDKLMQGANTLLSLKDQDIEVGITPKELVFQDDKMKLYRYKPVCEEIVSVPILIVYALVNRQYMLDLQADKSIIASWLEKGLDVYIIDWGYPDQSDKYLTLEDYIDGYINDAVDVIRKRSGVSKINLLGVCQGGTFSVIYSALYPEKVKNLATMVTPVDFSTNDSLLFRWSKHFDVDDLVDSFGVIPGGFMNVAFLMLKPFQLSQDKYLGLLDSIDNPKQVEEFLRMEKWIYDSPGLVGEALRKFIKDLYQENRLILNTLELGGRVVNLKNINMPLLNVIAEYDHLVPPPASRPLNDAVSSEDKQLLVFPGGHIGLFVSSRSKQEVSPSISNWFKERS
jgi:polyhydroxyalkanoate synthase